MKTDEAKKIFRQRQQVVEPAIGNYKENLGFRGFLTRGLKSVKKEFNLVCTAVNLRKIWIYSNKNDQLERKKEINGTFHFKMNGIIDIITSIKVKNF
jgi:transposase